MLYIKNINYKEKDNLPNEYPFNLSISQYIDQLLFDNEVTIILGENGEGKSTILETLAALLELNMEGGSVNNSFHTKETHSQLYEQCYLSKYPNYPKDKYFYRAESFYNLATEFDELDLSSELFERSLHAYSRGESVNKLVNERLFGKGIYLFDEPETGLSFQSQLALLVSIQDLVDKESQFIISTHSPLIAMFPNAKIYEIINGVLVETKLEETHFIRNWEAFSELKENFIQRLFEK